MADSAVVVNGVYRKLSKVITVDDGVYCEATDMPVVVGGVYRKGWTGSEPISTYQAYSGYFDAYGDYHFSKGNGQQLSFVGFDNSIYATSESGTRIEYVSTYGGGTSIDNAGAKAAGYSKLTIEASLYGYAYYGGSIGAGQMIVNNSAVTSVPQESVGEMQSKTQTMTYTMDIPATGTTKVYCNWHLYCSSCNYNIKFTFS